MKISVIGMPLHLGADKLGSNHGPEKLREMGLREMLEKLGYTVSDMGDIEVLETHEDEKYLNHHHLKYLKTIVDANTKLGHRVYDAISDGSFPLILGGDHSLGLGSISGLSKYVNNLGIVWIDAHGDLNTEESSPTGNIHGMPLAASMGLGHSDLVNIFEERIKVKESNIVHIAGRDIDEGELEIIKASKIKFYSMEMVKEMGLKRVIDESIEYLRDRVDGIHLSFDLDSIDKEYVPGTGTPVHDGLTVEEAKETLGAFAASGKMVSMDFVELNPLIDEEDITAKISMELLEHTFKNLKVR